MELWHDFIAIFIALFVMTDPLGNVAIFLGITEDDDLATRRRQALKAAIYVFLLLFVFFIGGTYIMQFFGITLESVRIGGGLIVAGVGFSLMSSQTGSTHSGEEREESTAKQDVSFTPLAMPLLAGPGALAVVIAASARAGEFHWGSYAAISLAILATALLIWVCLHWADLLLKVMGKNGIGAITKIFGFLLICIAVQMIILGSQGVLADWGLIDIATTIQHGNKLPF